MTNSIKIVFYGTSPFAAGILASIADDVDVILVVTRPDAVAKRGRKTSPSAVKATATELGLAVACPNKLDDRDPAYAEILETAAMADVGIVASYGGILPEHLIETPTYGTLNVHASLLPRWRGAAPIERAILAGDKVGGSTIMQLDSGLDTGNIIFQEEIPIADGDMYQSLSDNIARTGVRLLKEAFVELAIKKADGDRLPLPARVQDKEGVCYAEKIGKGELDLHSTDDEAAILRKVRASSSSHPARTMIAERDIIVLEASSFEEDLDIILKAGQAAFYRKKLICACKNGTIEIMRVKPAGKGEMSAKAFCAGAVSKGAVVKWGFGEI